MSQSSMPPDSTDDLQFATAEPGNVNAGVSVPGRKCVLCRQPLVSMYYAVRDKVLCPACYDRVNAPLEGSGPARVMKATVLGLGAGLVGALIWFAIRRAAHLEIGLVAILVGYMVGKAVRKGSGGRGGRGYQVLAVVLTYSCIAANYMPDIVEAFIQGAHDQNSAVNLDTGAASDGQARSTTNNTPDDNSAGSPPPHISAGKAVLAIIGVLVIAFGFALAAPFMSGAQNLIGLLIIAFALWQAWKLAAPRRLAISGPYKLGVGPSGPAGVVTPVRRTNT